jgi:tetratricopeptide (TPR) repeat protein
VGSSCATFRINSNGRGEKVNSVKRRRIIISAILFLGFGLPLYFAGCSSNPSFPRWTGLNVGSSLPDFISGIRPASGNPDSHYLLGRYYQDRGRHKDAAEEYKKVLSIDPKHVEAYNALGNCYDLLGKFPEAAEAYREALRLNPELDYLHNNLGYSFFLQGDADGAVAAFRKAISLNDRDSRFHNNLGLAYGQKGEYELALAEFKLAGDEAKAHFNLAQIYFGKGLYRQAKEQFAKAMVLNPSLTIARTGVEAAGRLASIFQPVQKANPEALVAPEVTAKATIPPADAGNPAESEIREVKLDTYKAEFRRTAELETATTTLKQPAAASDLRKSRPEPGESTDVLISLHRQTQESHLSLNSQFPSPLPSPASGEAVSGPILVTLHPETQNAPPPWTGEGKGGGDKNPKLNNSISQSSSAPPARPIESRKENGLPYEVRVASFSSYKIALRELGDLQRSGLRANLTTWTDRKGKQWHTLTAGPWATREEALACKSKMEKGGRFKPIIEQKPLKGTGEVMLAHNENGIQKSLNGQREPGIEISNGNGVNGMAARVRTYLNQRGLKVIRLTNADSFAHLKTSIFYQTGFYHSAGVVAQHLPGVEKMEEMKEFDRPNVNIRVVIGKELFSHGNLANGGPRS